MQFEEMLTLLQQSKNMRRKSWGPNKFIWYKDTTPIRPEMCNDPDLKQIVEDVGGVITGVPTIGVIFNSSEYGPSILTGWLPTQEDLFADDWEEATI